MTDMIRARGLVKRYRDVVALSGLDLTVGEGRVLGLLGPNGAGKTTAFYMIVGLVPTDAGRILIDDQDISKLPVHEVVRGVLVLVVIALFIAVGLDPAVMLQVVATGAAGSWAVDKLGSRMLARDTCYRLAGEAANGRHGMGWFTDWVVRHNSTSERWAPYRWWWDPSGVAVTSDSITFSVSTPATAPEAPTSGWLLPDSGSANP